MALFTDFEVITLDDLLTFENSIGQVASAHGIDVDAKIALATSEIAERLRLWILAQSPYEPMWFSPWMNRNFLDLGTVVVTSALQHWLCNSSLAKVFAEAYNVQLNTRFRAKWQEYRQAAQTSADTAFRAGLGMVSNPLPKPPMPLLSVLTGSLSAQSIFIQTAWVDRNGNESAPSPENGFVLGNDSSVTVAILANTASAPAAAAGWSVYGGTSEDKLTRQNAAPLAIGSTWQMPDSGFAFGTAPGTGQRPDYYIQLSRQLQRG
ncbi:MAG TPA: hypothetical protein VF283_22625 [Bryobacteraceae bacterium]